MITCTIDFHGPVGVATGAAGRGLDVTVHHDVIPASSLKGVMKAAAQWMLFRNNPALVHQVFGFRRLSCPWSWSSARFEEPRPRPRTRVSLDERGIAREDFLLAGEEVWVQRATFTIEPLLRCDDPGVHDIVLRASAAAVHSLGMDRRRGLGWVTITPEPAVTSADIAHVLGMADNHA